MNDGQSTPNSELGVEANCPTSCTFNGHEMAQTDQSKRAPVQSDRFGGPCKIKMVAGTVAWAEHYAAWWAYTGGTGRDQQSAERIAERAGFGYQEMTDLLGHEPTTWEPTS